MIFIGNNECENFFHNYANRCWYKLRHLQSISTNVSIGFSFSTSPLGELEPPLLKDVGALLTTCERPCVLRLCDFGDFLAARGDPEFFFLVGFRQPSVDLKTIPVLLHGILATFWRPQNDPPISPRVIFATFLRPQNDPPYSPRADFRTPPPAVPQPTRRGGLYLLRVPRSSVIEVLVTENSSALVCALLFFTGAGNCPRILRTKMSANTYVQP